MCRLRWRAWLPTLLLPGATAFTNACKNVCAAFQSWGALRSSQRWSQEGWVGSRAGQLMCLLPPALEAVTQAVSCLSQPPGGVPGTQPLLPNSMDPTRQQGRESRQRGGPGGWGGAPLRSLLTARGSSIVLHRSPQHGRVNAENEPSPRHGAHGAWPTGNQLPVCLSICLPCHLCAPAFSPSSTVCRSPTVLALS